MVFLAACTVGTGGLLDERPWGDPQVYERYADLMLEGLWPYRDFYVEYPPGAPLVFVLPAWLESVSPLDYVVAFRLTIVAMGIALLTGVASLARAIGVGAVERRTALFVVATAPLLLGHVFLNRYDAWPTLLLVLALLLVVRRRILTGSALLGAATAAKLFPALGTPFIGIALARERGLRSLGRATLSFSLGGLLLSAPFLVLGLGGVGFSLYTQATRDLHVESLGGSALLALDRLGLYEAEIVAGMAIDLAGTAPDVLALASSIAVCVAVAAAVGLYWLGPDTDARLVTAVAVAVTGFVVFAKALSPQFLVWLLPLIPLARRGRARTALILFVAALVLTQIEQHGYVGLEVDDWAVWTLLARNLLLVGMFFVLLRALRLQAGDHGAGEQGARP